MLAALALLALLLATVGLEVLQDYQKQSKQPKANKFDIVVRKIDLPAAPPGGVFAAAAAMEKHLQGFALSAKPDVKPVENGFTVLCGNQRLRARAYVVADNANEKKRFALDMSMRPDTLSIESEAYSSVPIEHFGAAMLRGMGWTKETGVGVGSNGVFEISTTAVLGVTEVELANTLIKGVTTIIGKEMALEQGLPMELAAVMACTGQARQPLFRPDRDSNVCNGHGLHSAAVVTF